MREHAGWDPVPGAFHLFWVDVAEVAFIRYEETTGDQFVTLWPARREFVRRGTGATSLGDPQHYAALLSGSSAAHAARVTGSWLRPRSLPAMSAGPRPSAS